MHQDRRGRETVEVGARGGHPAPDHVRVGAGGGHAGVGALVARRADRDPRLVDAEHGARVLGEPFEDHAGVAEPLRRGHAAGDGSASPRGRSRCCPPARDRSSGSTSDVHHQAQAERCGQHVQQSRNSVPSLVDTDPARRSKPTRVQCVKPDSGGARIQWRFRRKRGAPGPNPLHGSAPILGGPSSPARR